MRAGIELESAEVELGSADVELGSADVMSTVVVLGAIVELAETTVVFIGSVTVKVENGLRLAVVVFI